MIRVLHEKRLLLGSGLLALLALSQGCSGDPNATIGPPVSQEQQNAERDARQRAYGQGMPVGKGGKVVKPHVRRS
jgi:hypothetical protein